MKIAKKLATFGVASLLLGVVALPMSASAKSPANKLIVLEQGSNAAVDVATELNCSGHTLTAKVKNKTDANMTPEVTFNDAQPSSPSDLPIEPGKTGHYFFNYSGNDLLVNVKVAVDTYVPVELSPTLYCTEPVSFMVTLNSSSAVVGTLRNNSSLVAQTVLVRANAGDARVETLQPGESRMIAMPFKAWPSQKTAFVTVGTTTGYEGTYVVGLAPSRIIYNFRH